MPTMTRHSPLLTLREAAEYLRCTPQALYLRVHHRKVPYSKIHGRLYFLRDDLDRQIQQHRVEASPEARLRAAVAALLHEVRPSRGKGRAAARAQKENR